MAKIFVRNRQRVKKGAKRPRFMVVATEGLDLKINARHIRRKELDALSESVGADVVFLPGGDKTGKRASGKDRDKGKDKAKDKGKGQEKDKKASSEK